MTDMAGRDLAKAKLDTKAKLAGKTGVAAAGPEAKAAASYSKLQIISSMRYQDRRDLLITLLKVGRDYTLDEVDAVLEGFLTEKATKDEEAV